MNRADSYVAGFFIGCTFLCALMLIIPKPTDCAVKMQNRGAQMTVIHFGVVSKY